MHLVTAEVESLFTVALVVLMGLAFRGDGRWARYSVYSLVTGVLIPIMGGATAAATAQGSAILGPLERCTIGLFLLWAFVVAIKAYRIEPSAESRPE